LLYSPDRTLQDLAPAVRAAYPAEPNIRFISLNDSGMVSGTSMTPVTGPGTPSGYTQHVFRYTPGSSAGVVTVAFTTTNRRFPRGPFVMDDAANVIYSIGFPPAGASIFTAAGLTVETRCGSGVTGGLPPSTTAARSAGFGAGCPVPEICTLDPNTFIGRTTTLVDESEVNNSGGSVNSLNNKGDAVGWRGGFGDIPYTGIATLFISGQIVDINTLFPSGSGWVAQTADRINDAGEIAGTGTVDGIPVIFVLSPVPSTTYSAQPLCLACAGILLSNSGFAVAREASSPFRFLVSSPRGPDIEITDAANIDISTTLAPSPDPISQLTPSSPIPHTISSTT
jgi:hypothetical protein